LSFATRRIASSCATSRAGLSRKSSTFGLEGATRALTAKPAAPAAVIDLRGFVEIARRRLAWIIATAAICGSIALVYVLVAPTRYMATAQVLLDPNGLQILSNDLTPRLLQSETSLAEAESQLQVAVSEVVLRSVVEREHLASDKEFGQASDPLLSRLAALIAGSREQAPALKALRILQDRVYVRRPEKTFVLNISVWTESPDKSARIANALAASYLDQENASNAEAALRTNASLVARLEELRLRVQESDRRVEQYKTANKIVTAGGQLVNEQQLSDMNRRLTLAREHTAQQSARYAEIERLRKTKASPDAIAEVTDSPTFTALRTKYAEAKQVEANALTALGARHPAMQAARAQVEASRKLVDDEVARMGQSALGDLNRARANEHAIETNLEALKQLAAETNASQVKLRELEREAESNRAIYAAFLSRAKEIGEQRGLEKSNARIITHALPPASKSNPSRLLVVAGAVCIGLLGGFGLGLVREQFDGRLYSASQITSEIALPVLAVLPREPARRGSRLSRIGPEPGLLALASYDPASEQGAPMQRLHDGLLDSVPMNHTRLVLVTSFDGLWARSIVALNLARAAAAEGERVLLIDSDPRQHRLTSSLGKADEAGFREVLEGRFDVSDVAVATPWEGVNLLTAGGPAALKPIQQPLHPSGDTIGEQLKYFHLVIMDGRVPFSDPLLRSFSNVIDDVIVVAEAGVSRKDDLHQLLRTLTASKMNIRGAVLVGGTN
jgi:polysaccharide biosynthesis transport protein